MDCLRDNRDTDPILSIRLLFNILSIFRFPLFFHFVILLCFYLISFRTLVSRREREKEKSLRPMSSSRQPVHVLTRISLLSALCGKIRNDQKERKHSNNLFQNRNISKTPSSIRFFSLNNVAILYFKNE